MNAYEGKEAWFITGSQHLYGEEALQQVAANSQHIVAALNAEGQRPDTPVMVAFLLGTVAAGHQGQSRYEQGGVVSGRESPVGAQSCYQGVR